MNQQGKYRAARAAKKGPKNPGMGRPPPPLFGQCPKENVFFVPMSSLTFGQPINPIGCGGGLAEPPYHINVVPRKMLKERVADFFSLFLNM